jgi:two-component system cell cycle sensor histidine kinase/response regulator CckA
VLFPAASAVPASTGCLLEPARDLRGSGLILIIDDEEMVRTAAEAALCRYGYHVESAANGDDGVAIFERKPDAFAAVLLDLTMAVTSADALKKIKRRRPDVPVIASRGYNEMEPYRRLPAGDLAAFLQKPYTSVDLARKLKKTLQGGLVH